MTKTEIAAQLKTLRSTRRADLVAADLPTTARHYLDAEIEDLEERLYA